MDARTLADETGGPPPILLVEDNPADARLAREAFREIGLEGAIRHVVDGVEALDYLRRCAAEDAWPRLVLLDLNLPRKDGREVLAEIKADPRMRRLPVIVMSTSVAEQDIQQCYALHANGFVAKPVDLGHFERVAEAISLFWLQVAELP